MSRPVDLDALIEQWSRAEYPTGVSVPGLTRDDAEIVNAELERRGSWARVCPVGGAVSYMDENGVTRLL